MDDIEDPVERSSVRDPRVPAAWSSVRLSSEAVQVLAHPLRARLLSALRVGGPATATGLAGDLGTNTGATSYHLRKLASVGLVEETGSGRGRERWWRPTTEMHGWDDESVEGDPDGQAAVRWLREHYLRGFVERAEGWLQSHDDWPLEWRRLSGASDYLLDLTVSQLDALLHDLWAVVARHRVLAQAAAEAIDADAGNAPGSADPADRPQRVALYIHDFPAGGIPR